MRIKFLTSMLVFMSLYFGLLGQEIPTIKSVQIWNNAEHSAFTDLIYYKNAFYCSFREGSGHVPGTDGVVRILRSKDGKSWQDLGSITYDGMDLRDPKLSVTPDNRLMIIIGGSKYVNGKLLGRTPMVSFFDGKHISKPVMVNIDKSFVSWGDWIWRVTWHKGIGYAVDYQIGPDERRGPTKAFIVKTTDGIKYEKVAELAVDGFANESTIRFEKNGDMVVMVRRELGDTFGVIAKSSYPYQNWNYNKMNYRLGGPNFLLYKNYIVGISRIHAKEIHTGLIIGKEDGNFKEVAKFPSSGDNSYAGMVILKGNLWVSYYSSHEGKSGIYISTIPLKDINKFLKNK